MKLLALFLLLLSATSLSSLGIVSAHVVITDKSSGTALLVHVTPADDPIAGQKSSIYLDVTKQTTSKYSLPNLVLSVKDSSQIITPVPFQVSGTTVVAEYTFPTQGLYTITLESPENSSMPIRLEYSLRVSRGVSAEPLKQSALGSSLITIGFIGLAVLTILAVNNRREIIHRSRF